MKADFNKRVNRSLSAIFTVLDTVLFSYPVIFTKGRT